MHPLLRQIGIVLKTYLKTQFIIMLTIALAVWLILSAIGVRFSLILGITTGALAAIPVWGMLTAAVITSLVTVIDDLRFLPNVPEITEGAVLFILFLILNVVIDYLIAPIITRKMTNMHPVITLLAVLTGSVLFGVVGAILAVPTALILRTIMKYYLSEHREES